MLCYIDWIELCVWECATGCYSQMLATSRAADSITQNASGNIHTHTHRRKKEQTQWECFKSRAEDKHERSQRGKFTTRSYLWRYHKFWSIPINEQYWNAAAVANTQIEKRKWAGVESGYVIHSDRESIDRMGRIFNAYDSNDLRMCIFSSFILSLINLTFFVLLVVHYITIMTLRSFHSPFPSSFY